MAQLKFDGEVFNVTSGDSVLDTLLGNDKEIPNNCRVGACQSCLMQVTKGHVPEESQKGLKDSFKVQGYFLACSCKPEENIEISLPDSEKVQTKATVKEINKLTDDVIELKIQTIVPYEFFAGQYVTLWSKDKVGRSYSLASLPDKNNILTFHIKLVPNGVFSHWLHNVLKVNDTLYVQGPAGDCFYTKGKEDQNLLLVGTGTGLAPLYGIIHDALESGHTGEIHLFHGALNPYGLYLHDILGKLANNYSNLFYHPCVLRPDDEMPSDINAGDIADIVLTNIPKTNGWKTFLCGDPDLVVKLRKKIFLAGCDMKEIYSDPFVSASE